MRWSTGLCSVSGAWDEPPADTSEGRMDSSHSHGANRARGPEIAIDSPHIRIYSQSASVLPHDSWKGKLVHWEVKPDG